MHIADESTIADHCMTYALSDSRDSSFRQRCQHIHKEHCSECDSMNSVLNEICEFVEQDSFLSKDDSDEAQYLAQHSRDTILAWKAHQLRTVWQAFGIGPGKDINLEAANGKFSKPSITFCYCS